MKRLVLVEDHQLFADGIASILARQPDLTLAAHVTDGESALQRIPRLWPDLVLIDLALPGINGLEVIRRLRRHQPHLPIVVLSMHGERALIRAAIDHAVNGYLLKSSTESEFLRAVRVVLGGDRCYSAGLTEGLLE